MSNFCKADISLLLEISLLIDLDKRCFISAEMLSRRLESIRYELIPTLWSKLFHLLMHLGNTVLTLFLTMVVISFSDTTLFSDRLLCPITPSACAERQAFYNYHSALHTADDISKKTLEYYIWPEQWTFLFWNMCTVQDLLRSVMVTFSGGFYMEPLLHVEDPDRWAIVKLINVLLKCL